MSTQFIDSTQAAIRKIIFSLPLPKLLIRVYNIKLKIDFSLLLSYLEGYEPFTTELFVKSIKPNSIILDIGASIGHYSILAGKYAHNGKIYAFEPSPKDFHLLLENIRLNNLKNVCPIEKAVSNINGRKKLYVTNELGLSSFTNRNSLKYQEIEVETVKIDDFLKKDKKVDIIKMDIEGAELLALEGMKNTIKRNKNLIIFSELPFLSSPKKFLSKLQELGFNFKIIDEKKKELRDVERKDFQVRNNLYCYR